MTKKKKPIKVSNKKVVIFKTVMNHTIVIFSLKVDNILSHKQPITNLI
jgi:hypothetical protein